MTDQPLRVTVNLDLSDSVFAAVTSAYARVNSIDPSRCVTSDAFKGMQVPASEDIEIVILSSRAGIIENTELEQTAAQMSSFFDLVDEKQLNNAIKSVILLDCGDRYSGPLSDFLVVSRYLEEISFRVSEDVVGKVLAADYDSESFPVPIVTIRDTSSSDFLDHMMDHVQKSLESINRNFGGGSLPQVGSASQEEVTEALASLLEETYKSNRS